MVREISDNEYGRLAEIEAQSFNNPWGENEYRNFSVSPFFKIVVSEISGKIVGFCIYTFILGDVEIMRIAVDPAFRGNGYAEEILREILKENVENAFLEVRVSNTPAIKLYEKLGFGLIGERKNYYEDGEDALVLGRKAI